MPIIRGPFEIQWGGNTISDVEELAIEHTIDSEDFETLGGRTLEIDGNFKATAILTLLASDITALSLVLPQHWVANGGILSTGETVNNAAGAIDIVPRSCDDAITYHNLDIISCGSPANIARIVNARTKYEGIEIDNKIQRVMIKFVGEADPGDATMQFFRQGTINVVS